MNNFRSSIIRSSIIIIILFSFFSSFAQNEEKKQQYNIHKNEVGIDFQNLFSGVLGASVIYKKRIGEKKFISLDEKKALRISLGGRGELPLTDRLDVLNDTLSPLNFTDLLREGFQFHCLVGLEWQKQRNRVQYFYGLETGFRYFKYKRLVGWSWNSISGYTFRFNDEVNQSIPLIGFFGVKYFLSKEFSISIETNLQVNYQHEKIDRTLINRQNGTEFESKDIIRKEINFNLDYLSSLNFSYYF